MTSTFVRRTGMVIGVTGLLALGTAAPSFADVGQDQARQVVLDKTGGTIKSIESDSEKGQPTWEVEVEGSPDYGRIEIDVAKSDGSIIACEAEDGEGTCPSDLGNDGDSGANGAVDDTDNDGDVDGDDAAMGGGGTDNDGDGDVDADDAAMGGATGGGQVGTMPSGGADTGISTAPANDGAMSDEAALALAGGAALVLAGGGLVWTRTRRAGSAN